MIDRDTQLKIQAFLDGELAGNEAKAIAALIAADHDAAALHSELKNTRRALSVAESDLRVPETREFYWSRISRGLEQLERMPQTEPASLWRVLAAWLKPLGAVAAVAIVGILVWHQGGGEAMVTAQVDADAITFQDDASGTTFVWFNYPAQNRVATEGDSNTLN